MGGREVLRLLGAAEPRLAGAVLLGTAPTRPSRFSAEAYERFRGVRRLKKPLPKERYMAIRARFYDTTRMIARLAPDHPPILVVRFGHEYGDVAAVRDALYEALPGPKAVWDFAEASHHLNAHTIGGVVVGDARVTSRLAARLRKLLDETEATAPKAAEAGAGDP
jgi:hypothetical protein